MNTLRKGTKFDPCPAHAAMYAVETRRRKAEVMTEGGWASSPCPGRKCSLQPGTDFFAPSFVAAHPTYNVGEEI